MTEPVYMFTFVNRQATAVAYTAEGADAVQGPAVSLTLRERVSQIEKHGHDFEHDDRHDDGAIGRAALAYALAGLAYAQDHDVSLFGKAERNWPWDLATFRPSDELACHIKAAALHLAEADRIIRAQALIDAARGGV